MRNLNKVFLGSDAIQQGLFITPNKTAADSLGVAAVTLESLAIDALPPTTIASYVQSRQCLTQAITNVLGDCDALGFSKYFAGAVRELLRLNADLGLVASRGGRMTKLAEVARAFKNALATRGLIDSSQVFFKAAKTVTPIQLTVTGYPRLGLGELTFLDAVAADGSQLVLPFADDALFTENLEAAQLSRRGAAGR